VSAGVKVNLCSTSPNCLTEIILRFRESLPSSPFLGALAHIRERRVGLSAYLDDPEVSIDTNKKNWLFSWAELGAKHIDIVQSMLATCRRHDISPYDYFVDVLQRVGQHPASLVHQLTPRI
jgi:hypothetical protein